MFPFCCKLLFFYFFFLWTLKVYFNIFEAAIVTRKINVLFVCNFDFVFQPNIFVVDWLIFESCFSSCSQPLHFNATCWFVIETNERTTALQWPHHHTWIHCVPCHIIIEWINKKKCKSKFRIGPIKTKSKFVQNEHNARTHAISRHAGDITRDREDINCECQRNVSKGKEKSRAFLHSVSKCCFVSVSSQLSTWVYCA